jgi:organic radical activating enzyme
MSEKQTAYIGEIFSSIQGEGIYAGIKQIFVRFMNCSLRCVYCDTPYSRMKDGFCSVEAEPQTGKFVLVSNPLNIPKLNKFVNALEKKSPGHHSISITGGEPLEQADFIREWLKTIRGKFKFYLETNGMFPQALKKILTLVDTIAMDIKLPSAIRMSVNWKSVMESLKLSSGKDLFVKVVVTSRTDKYEVLKAALMVKKISDGIPFILQPATKYGAFFDSPDQKFLLHLQTECLAILKDVRVIPQVHKFLNVH